MSRLKNRKEDKKENKKKEDEKKKEQHKPPAPAITRKARKSIKITKQDVTKREGKGETRQDKNTYIRYEKKRWEAQDGRKN